MGHFSFRRDEGHVILRFAYSIERGSASLGFAYTIETKRRVDSRTRRVAESARPIVKSSSVVGIGKSFR